MVLEAPQLRARLAVRPPASSATVIPITRGRLLAANPTPGKYGFTNTKSETVFTVILYYREGSDEGRTITVPPGQTQYVYEFPAGAHNYIVTYRAMVPIMSFPPGAPTMPQDVIYLRGEINVEQCKTGSMEIR
jgi:hypothetical protein